MVQGDDLGAFPRDDDETAVDSNPALSGYMVTLLNRVNWDTDGSFNGPLSGSNLSFDSEGKSTAGDWEYGPSTVLVDIFVVKAGNECAAYRYTGANTNNMRNVGIWNMGGVRYVVRDDRT